MGRALAQQTSRGEPPPLVRHLRTAALCDRNSFSSSRPAAPRVAKSGREEEEANDARALDGEGGVPPAPPRLRPG
eukprot:1193740-Prorocentrum_minimum.AAC.5